MNWNRTYIVRNDEILDLVDLWKNAPEREKPIIQGRIVKKIEYIVKKRALSYKKTNFYDDINQEGRIGIITAIEKFDTSRSCNFFQYSIWHVQNKIRIFLKKENRKKEIPMEHIPDSTDNEDPYAKFEKIETREILLKEINKLSEIERVIVKMRTGLDGEGVKTYKSIGEIFSVSKQRIEQIYSCALSKLSKNIQLKEYFER